MTTSLLSSFSSSAMECKYLSFTEQVSPMITKSHWVNNRLYLEGKKPEVLDYSRIRKAKELVEKPQVIRLDSNTMLSVTADRAGKQNIEMILWKRDSSGVFKKEDSFGLSHKLSSALLENYVRETDALVDQISPLKYGQDPNWNYQNFLKLSLTAIAAIPVKAYQKIKEKIYLARNANEDAEIISKFIDYKIVPLNAATFALVRRAIDSRGGTTQLTEVFELSYGKLVQTESYAVPLKRYDYDKVRSVFLGNGKMLDVGISLGSKKTSFHERTLYGKNLRSSWFELSLPNFEKMELMGPNEVLIRSKADQKKYFVVGVPRAQNERPSLFSFMNEGSQVLAALKAQGFKENQLIGSYASSSAKDSVFMHIPKSWSDVNHYSFLQNGVLQTRSTKEGGSLSLQSVISLPHAAISSIAKNAESLNVTELRRALKNSYSINGNQKIYRRDGHLVILSESYKYNQRFFVSVKMSTKGEPLKAELSMFEELKGDSDKVLSLKIGANGTISTTKVKDLE